MMDLPEPEEPTMKCELLASAEVERDGGEDWEGGARRVAE
jgi:hypothetical protein